MAVMQGHSDAGCDPQVALTGEAESFSIDLLAQVLGDPHGTAQISVNQQHQEFFAAQSKYVVGPAPGVSQQYRELLENMVASFVTVIIIDLLEMIDVNGQHGKISTAMPGIVHFLAEDHGKKLAA